MEVRLNGFLLVKYLVIGIGKVYVAQDL